MLRYKIITDFRSLKDEALNKNEQHIIFSMSALEQCRSIASLNKAGKAAIQIALAKLQANVGKKYRDLTR